MIVQWYFAAWSILSHPILANRVPVQSFNSRPDILAPVLDVRVYDPDKIAPGHIFLSTWDDGLAQNGPYIYQSDGHLLWSGHDPSMHPMQYFNFQPFAAGDKATKAFVFRGASDKGRGQGHVAILDSSYNVTKTVRAPPHLRSLDFHEFQVRDNGRYALAVAMQPIQADLTEYEIEDGLGWLLDNIFLSIDLETEEVLFEWHASHHIDLAAEVTLIPSKQRGAGLSYSQAFDFFHINSIDRFQNGDYLICARHTDALYRINAASGDVVWRIGGKAPDIQLHVVNFSGQHDARIIKEDSSRILISLFDNAYNGIKKTSSSSSAKIIEIDVERRTATIVKEFLPQETTLSQNQGSMQYLRESGNYLVSWGIAAEFSEFSNSGERILDVAFVDETTRNYRVHKADWVAKPITKPDLYLYARNKSASTHFWMSWNGATEVIAWRAYEVQQQADGKSTRIVLGSVKKDSFESHISAEKFVEYGYVEAFGPKDILLARSEIRHVMMPSDRLQRVCGDEHCTMQILVDEEAVDTHQGEGQPYERVMAKTAMGYQQFGIDHRTTLVFEAVCIFAVGTFLTRTPLGRSFVRRISLALSARLGAGQGPTAR